MRRAVEDADEHEKDQLALAAMDRFLRVSMEGVGRTVLPPTLASLLEAEASGRRFRLQLVNQLSHRTLRPTRDQASSTNASRPDAVIGEANGKRHRLSEKRPRQLAIYQH